MKACTCIAMMVLLGGCGVELLTTTAIQGELQAEQLKAIKGQVTRAGDQTAKINIQRAIDTFQAEKGRFPESLDELVPGYLPSLPTQPNGMSYNYDPATGKLIEGSGAPPAPAPGPTAADRQKMNQILVAIDGYGRATGYYPPSLAALVPTYLPSVPKTDAGEDFLFDPVVGALRHPAEGRGGSMAGRPAPAPQSRPVGVGGAGPMGEVMTGIGIQNQLNSMSNSGSSAAGSYARQSIGNTTGQHNQQQEQAMDNLGL